MKIVGKGLTLVCLYIPCQSAIYHVCVEPVVLICEVLCRFDFVYVFISTVTDQLSSVFAMHMYIA